MRGFILASLVSMAYALCVVWFFRSRMPERRAAVMLRAYFVSLLPLAAGLAFAPRNLWFLPEWLVEPNRWLDSAFALFAYSASVFGGWLQLYNLADRGMSLRILIDAMEAGGTIDADGLSRKYGGGKGIQWMYQKRLDDIQRLGLVTTDGEHHVLSVKGSRNARLIGWLRKCYALAPTKELG